MSVDHVPQLTALLHGLCEGSACPEDERLAALYAELRCQARQQARRAPLAAGPVASSDLAHDAYCRLFGQSDRRWNDRHHFLASAAQTMRRMLIDRWRRAEPIADALLDAASFGVDPHDAAALQEAFDRLTDLDPTQTRIVEMTTFGGWTLDEVAALEGKSVAWVHRHRLLGLKCLRDWVAAPVT